MKTIRENKTKTSKFTTMLIAATLGRSGDYGYISLFTQPHLLEGMD